VKGTASVVIRGWIFYRNNQWEELRQLDAQLARISTADLWYPRALELRARWRLQVINADESVTREAAEFVEQALGGMQNERLFELRAYVAILLDEDFRYLESVIYVGASIFRRVQQANAGQLQLGEEGREELLRVIDGHISRFDEKFLATTGDRAIWARGELMRVREALAIQR
jgi:hypothetical protein